MHLSSMKIRSTMSRKNLYTFISTIFLFEPASLNLGVIIFWKISCVHVKTESAKSRALRALAATRLTHHWYAPYVPARLRTLPIINKRLHAYAPFFVFFFVKFASNVIDSLFYNIIIKSLEKNKYSEEPTTALETHFQEKWKKQARQEIIGQ